MKWGGGIDNFENEYRIRIQHFSIDTFLSFDTFDNPNYFLKPLCIPSTMNVHAYWTTAPNSSNILWVEKGLE